MAVEGRESSRTGAFPEGKQGKGRRLWKKVKNQPVSTIPCPATSRTMNTCWVTTAPSGRWISSFSAFLPSPVRPSMSRCKNLPEILIKMWFLFLIRFDYILWGRSFLRKPSFMSKSCVSKKVYCMSLIINSRQVYGLMFGRLLIQHTKFHK